MFKKLFAMAVLTVSLSAVAYQGYRYATAAPEEKEPEIKQESRADLFALQELVSVMRQFRDAKTIDAEFTTMLVGADGKTDMGSFEGRYVKDEKNLYIQSIESENLLNKDFFVAVDHTQKMIFIEKPEMQNPGDFFRFGFLADIDSLVNLPDSVVFYEQLDDHTAKLSFEWEYAQYYKTELIYDIETKALKRVHLYPYQDVFLVKEEGEISDKPDLSVPDPEQEEIPLYVAIVYSRLRLNEDVNPKWFDASRYFRMHNNVPALTKAYKDYESDYE